MNKTSLLTFVLVSALGFSASALAKVAKVDKKASKIEWEGSKFTGESHEGTLQLKDAEIKFKNGEPQSATIEVDMRSINVTDIKNKKDNAKLTGHLKSDDFFGVKKHKTAVLKVDKFRKITDKLYYLIGELTIKGKTRPIKLEADVENDGKKKVVETEFTFDRSKFNVRYGSGTFFDNLGDKMINDDIEVEVELAMAI